MKTKILIAALMIVGLTSAPVFAQSGTGTVMELSLDDAVRIALSDNPTIKVADLEIERQDYVRRETLGNLYPNLSATGSYNYSAVKQEMSRSGLSFGADNTLTATANLTVPLFAPAVYASLKLNRSQMEAAVESARSSKITLVNQVKNTYYGILLAQQSLEVLDESKAMLQKVVDNTATLYENQLSSEYDYLTAQVQLSNIEPNIIQTQSAHELLKMQLRMLLELPQDVEFSVVGDLDSFMAESNAAGMQFTTDTSENSDLRTLDIQAQMLEQQVKLINTQRMPTIVAFGSATITGNDMPDMSLTDMMGSGSSTMPDINWSNYPTLGPIIQPLMPELMGLMGEVLGGGGSTGGGSSSKFWWQNPVSVGVQISIPIFTGNKNVNQVRQVKNSITQLNLQRNYLEESIKLQIQSSINNVFTARERMYANEKTIAQAEKAYQISLTRYDNGMGTILELSNAELSLTQARLNYSQAIYDYLSAQAEYEKTVGREYDPSYAQANY